MNRNNNNSIIVFGVNGTSADRYSVRYLKWKFISLYGRLPTSCSVLNCRGSGNFEATAHVMLDDGRRSDDWYLVPQCKYCNNHSRNGERMALRVNAVLIKLSDVRLVDDATALNIKRRFGVADSDLD